PPTRHGGWPMAEQTPVTLNHFGLVRTSPAYWALSADDRRDVRCGWLERLRKGVDAVHLYQAFGLDGANDLITWTAKRGDDAKAFFAAHAAAVQPVRQYLTFGEPLWGFTRPSQYTKTRSTQELDPFEARDRASYLIVYPFVKTTPWYLTPREERQA